MEAKIGTEHKVEQRSEAWFALRKTTLLTASQFGDAIGVGKGKPYDFFISLISDDSIFEPDDILYSHLQHGIDTEVIIKEAYEMLTGNLVRDSGFWTPHTSNPLKNLIGASPDGVVYHRDEPEGVRGLTEFKAPVYKMYSGGDLIHGIPRHYMAQVQGQMAVVNAPWCDFMAVCTKTREIMLKRVHFQPLYWSHVSNILRQFCHILQESRVRADFGQDPTGFLAAKNLRMQPPQKQKFPGEDSIQVDELLHTKDGTFQGPSKVSLSFEVLMGLPYNNNVSHENMLEHIDRQIGGQTHS